MYMYVKCQTFINYFFNFESSSFCRLKCVKLLEEDKIFTLNQALKYLLWIKPGCVTDYWLAGSLLSIYHLLHAVHSRIRQSFQILMEKVLCIWLNIMFGIAYSEWMLKGQKLGQHRHVLLIFDWLRKKKLSTKHGQNEKRTKYKLDGSLSQRSSPRWACPLQSIALSSHSPRCKNFNNKIALPPHC